MKKLSFGKPFLAPAMLALALVLGLAFVSCDDGSGNGGGSDGIPAALVARWYSRQTAADEGGISYFAFEITSNGRYIGSTGGDLPCSVSGNTVTVYTTGGNYTQGTFKFIINGTEITVSDGTGIFNTGRVSTYYKRAN